MSVKCYSVRLAEFRRVSDKCYKAVAFDGSEALIPASQYYGEDLSVSKSDAYWISAWILGKKDIQYSTKKVAYFNEDGKMVPVTVVTENIPEKVAPKDSNIINDLTK